MADECAEVPESPDFINDPDLTVQGLALIVHQLSLQLQTERNHRIDIQQSVGALSAFATEIHNDVHDLYDLLDGLDANLDPVKERLQLLETASDLFMDRMSEFNDRITQLSYQQQQHPATPAPAETPSSRTVTPGGKRILMTALRGALSQPLNTNVVNDGSNAHDRVRPEHRRQRGFYSRADLLSYRPSVVDTLWSSEDHEHVPLIIRNQSGEEADDSISKLAFQREGGHASSKPRSTSYSTPSQQFSSSSAGRWQKAQHLPTPQQHHQAQGRDQYNGFREMFTSFRESRSSAYTDVLKKSVQSSADRWLPNSILSHSQDTKSSITASDTADDQSTLSFDSTLSKIRALINKLTPKTVEKFSHEICEYMADFNEESHIGGLIHLICARACDEKGLISKYAQLCSLLDKTLTTVFKKDPQGTYGKRSPEEKHLLTFRRVLMIHCEDIFTSITRNQQAKEDEVPESTESSQQIPQLNNQQRRCFCRFLGELFKVGLLHYKICVAALDELSQAKEEDDLYVVLDFLDSLIDPAITLPPGFPFRQRIEKLKSIKTLSNDVPVSKRFQFAILDLEDKFNKFNPP